MSDMQRPQGDHKTKLEGWYINIKRAGLWKLWQAGYGNHGRDTNH